MTAQAKQEAVCGISGIIMDAVNDNTQTLDELNEIGMKAAGAVYDALLPPNRAILTDRDGNVVGSIDLTGVANLWMKSELDWRRIVYRGLQVTE
jgi:hypothetical protein